MNWFLGVFAFLRSIPEILKLFIEIRKVIRDISAEKTKKERTLMLKDALREARKTGNFEKLEELFSAEKE